MIQVNIPETKSEITKLIEYALAGEKVIIAKNEKPIVELKSLSKLPKSSQQKSGDRKELFGLLKNELKILDEDLSLPDDVVDSFYNSDIEHEDTH